MNTELRYEVLLMCFCLKLIDCFVLILLCIRHCEILSVFAPALSWFQTSCWCLCSPPVHLWFHVCGCTVFDFLSQSRQHWLAWSRGRLCPAGGWVDLKVFAPLQKPPLPVGAGVPWVRVVNICSVCSQYSAKVSDLKSNRNMYKEEKIFWLPPLCARVWDCLTWSRRATWTPLYKHDCSFLYPPSLQIITRKYKLTFSLLHRVPPLSSLLECESSEL